MSKERELIKQYKEYIEFLNRANETPIRIAALHGWECPKEDIEEGVRRRKRIDEIRDFLNNF